MLFLVAKSCAAPVLQGQVRIKFVDEHGMEEAGIDGGGLFKDFMEHLVREVRAYLPEPYTAEGMHYSSPYACSLFGHCCLWW